MQLLESLKQYSTLYYYLDKNNNAFPCRSLKEIKDVRDYYYEDGEGVKRRMVKQDNINYKNDNLFISTMFLLFDHNYNIYTKKPILFETMLFHKDENIDNWMMRYSTYDEALKGHDRVLKIFEYLEKRYQQTINITKNNN